MEIWKFQKKIFPNTMNWEDAKKACQSLGNGWRLPNIDELNLLYQNKYKIGSFGNNFYWSSTEYDNNYAWTQNLNSGLQDPGNEDNSKWSVRAVRGFIIEALKKNILKETIGSPIKIGNLEISEKDFPKEMNWDDAIKACQSLGNGWRLPNKDELNLLYQNKYKIGGFANDEYWSSTENNNYYAWNQYFNSGAQSTSTKDTRCDVRAVRAF